MSNWAKAISTQISFVYIPIRKSANKINRDIIRACNYRVRLISSFVFSLQWMTFNEALLRAKNFGSGLISLGLTPGPKTFVCIYSQNRPEWILCEQGCYNFSLVLVPLYDTLGPDACAFIVNQTEAPLVVVEDDKKVNLLLDKAPKNLKKLVVIKPLRQATLQRAKNRGIDIHTFEEVEKLGAQKDQPELPPRPEDVCTICYTSGTTGNPKGVMLTHRNVLACIVSVCMQLGEFIFKSSVISLKVKSKSS